jgi:hypothetical protein
VTDRRPRGESITQRCRDSRRDGTEQGRNLGKAGSLERGQPTPGLARRWGATTVETRERVDRREARERTGGDGRPADNGGESLGEDENQEGIGLCESLNRTRRGTDSRREQSPEVGLPGRIGGLINLAKKTRSSRAHC